MLRPIFMGRICVIFGVALALLFAGASASNMLDQIQHPPGKAIDHDHLLFGSLTAELDHADDHDPSGDDRDETGRLLQGHHHHHGDTGSAIALDPSDRSLISLVRNHPHDTGPSSEKPGSGTTGPERPPRHAMISA